ncbi:TorD/DmsD family molecular chaperone [Slackia piriformis]|uniref:TorD/DmsD family molecular chaperone n=1 Tax=Slackia piriformis TaxID=626934 RepID=UPI0026DCB5E6|nr:molecular chaperone TorD family protein [Slackia piriformis]MDO5024825.1 molecular chaperone TorD family protein [Slackia piriformis]
MPSQNASLDNSISRVESTADAFEILSLLTLLPTRQIAQGVWSGALQKDMHAIAHELELGNIENTPEMHESFPYAANEEDVLEEMRRAYTALFTHPKKPLVAITEMSFVDEKAHAKISSSAFLNEAALHAEACYKKSGFALSNETSREPGDHMGIELEFLAKVHINLATALINEDEEQQQRWAERIKEFNSHMRTWGIDFFEACRNTAPNAFYAWAASFGSSFMRAYLS